MNDKRSKVCGKSGSEVCLKRLMIVHTGLIIRKHFCQLKNKLELLAEKATVEDGILYLVRVVA